MSVRILILSTVVMLIGIVPAYADHPKGNIDAYMKAHEPYFQVIDLPSAPPFELIDENERVKSNTVSADF